MIFKIKVRDYISISISFFTLIYLFLFVLSCEKLEVDRIIKIETGDTSNITSTSITVTGKILDLGQKGIEQCGHCWSTDKDPSLDFCDKTNLGKKDARGDITSEINGLIPGTIYHIRAYASNINGTRYGNEISFTTKSVSSQDSLGISWEKSFGGSNVEYVQHVELTTDGGYVIAGYSTSVNGDVSGNHGLSDYWIVKVTSAGRIDWQKSLGGSLNEYARCIKQTNDGGYIVVGDSESDDGDITDPKGGYDCWIVKLNSLGEISWQKSLGGSNYEYGYYIEQTTDDGYIFSATTYSNDGDVTDNNGNSDYWIVKLDALGNISWEKSLGGSDQDFDNRSIHQTTDEGYIVVGFSKSTDGDITNPKGENDYWIVKLNSEGDISWQKSLGGSKDDNPLSIEQTQDGGYVVAGWSESDDKDVSVNYGDWDYWIVKISSTGTLEWQKSFGGSGFDIARSVQQTTDDGYILAGYSDSDDGDISNPKGGFDFWVLKLDSAGDMVWEKSFGGSSDDYGRSIKQTTEGGFILAGDIISNDGDVTTNKGGSDYWILKLDFY